MDGPIKIEDVFSDLHAVFRDMDPCDDPLHVGVSLREKARERVDQGIAAGQLKTWGDAHDLIEDQDNEDRPLEEGQEGIDIAFASDDEKSESEEETGDEHVDGNDCRSGSMCRAVGDQTLTGTAIKSAPVVCAEASGHVSCAEASLVVKCADRNADKIERWATLRSSSGESHGAVLVEAGSQPKESCEEVEDAIEKVISYAVKRGKDAIPYINNALREGTRCAEGCSDAFFLAEMRSAPFSPSACALGLYFAGWWTTRW